MNIMTRNMGEAQKNVKTLQPKDFIVKYASSAEKTFPMT